MSQSQKIIVFGETKAELLIETDFDLKSIINNQLTTQNWQFKTAGVGAEMALFLAKHHQVSIQAELGDDLFSQKILHQFDEAGIITDFITQNANHQIKADFMFKNQLDQTVSRISGLTEPKFNLPALKSHYDWAIVSHQWGDMSQISDLLHLLVDSKIKIIYLLDSIANDDLADFKYLLEDVDVLATNAQAVSQITDGDLKNGAKYLANYVSNIIVDDYPNGALAIDFRSFYELNAQSWQVKPEITVDNMFWAGYINQYLQSKNVTTALEAAATEQFMACADNQKQPPHILIKESKNE